MSANECIQTIEELLELNNGIQSADEKRRIEKLLLELAGNLKKNRDKTRPPYISDNDDERDELLGFWLTDAELECVMDAARDAHMGTSEYARLMVLAAAGMGGVIEHLERVAEASFRVDQTGTAVEVES
jgi:hypothetical protein